MICDIFDIDIPHWSYKCFDYKKMIPVYRLQSLGKTEMQQTPMGVLALSIRQQDESFFCDVPCVILFFPVSPIFSISPSLILI